MDLTSSAQEAPERLEGLRKTWGSNVRTARKRALLTQQALAAKCRVQTSTISRIESGQWSPGDMLRIDLAAALGTSVTALFPYDKDEAA